ncbi:AAA family ATPase [Paracoccus seriniphilus]|uniref:Uncharacterized protein YhaN n=1 Tax=Paracoccus seriniphilus TaxID=184748 RepID=A0A239Q0U6_9RHOB|nr:AAA family ATPase [Paracoccus seriniphilus]WCR16293.1 AAA family ATPase [Paracoccus seriniphilus]SNT75873.1 Uncharacterized protein YhaN [Paracoccus seriniphilus]
MMRLRQLSLDLFGQFSGKTYDFGAATPGKPDFHIIYGPNEAGKTTTMEAFLRLLYGFPHRDGYDFLHQRKNLRVSGVLDIDGQSHDLVRLPKRDGSLVDGSGNALPEMILQNALGRLSLDDYRTLLCLDDETIEKGGEEIVKSRGDIGKLLFSAAAGVSDLTRVLDGIREQADLLYRKRASSTELARLKKELAETDKRIKELDIPASAYRKLRQGFDLARTEEDATRQERSRLRRKHARTEAQSKALPLIARIDALDASLTSCAHYPERLDFNPEDLVELLTQQTSAQGETDRLKALLQDLKAQRDAITRRPDLLSLGQALEELDILRSRDATARLDLQRRQEELRQVLADMQLAARNMQAAPDMNLQDLVPTEPELAELEAARSALHSAEQQLDAEQKEVARLKTRLDRAEAARDALGQGDETGAKVGQILERFSLDSLAPQHAAAQQAVADARTRMQDALHALTIQGRTFDPLPACRINADEAEELARQFRRLEERLEKAQEEDRRLAKEEDTHRLQIEGLIESHGLISDETAQAQLDARDKAWAQHRATLDEDSANHFEAAMRQVDASAQARLTHVRDQERLRHAQQELASLRVQREHQARIIQDLRDQCDALRAPLVEAAADLGLDPDISPAVFANWAIKRDAASAANQKLVQVTAQHQPSFDKAARLVAALSAEMDLDAPDFDTLVAKARQLQQQEQTRREQSAQARKSCDDLQAELTSRQNNLDEIAKAAQAARQRWHDLVQNSFKGQLSPDSLIHSLAPLGKLREFSVRRDNIQRQINGMERDQKAYAARLADLAEKHGVAADAGPEDLYDTLRELARQAAESESRYVALCGQIEKAEHALVPQQQILTRIAQRVEQLAALFPPDLPTATLPQLRQTALQAQKVIEDRQRRRDLVDEACAVLGASSLEEARKELEGCDPNALAAALADLDADLQRIDTALDEAIATRSAKERDLAAVTGDSDIAELTETRATLEAQIEETVMRYLTLDLGHRLADEAIRRYRDSHRSTMMEATERAFRDLTNGAYGRLTTQPSGNGETLLALDQAGMAKQAQDMSKGTRFQLFLALRAAAYEQLVAQGTCLPFFCDDIFETFDEERTRSACRLMGRIGQTGQAIYLTHHRHVVDIARQEFGEDLTLHAIHSAR